MGFLYCIQGFDQGVQKDIAGDVLTIGRDSSNHLVLNDSEVSRFHAEIRVDGQIFEVCDLQSSNGMSVNGKVQQRVRLKPGDRIQFGRTHLVFTTRQDQSSVNVSEEIRFDRDDAELSKIITSARPQITASDNGELQSLQPEDARRHLDVMYQTTIAVSQTLDIDLLLERLINLIFEWVSADRGCIILIDEKTQQMLPKVSRYREPDAEGDGLIISTRILDYVIEHSEGVLTSDASDDERWEAAGSIVGKQIKEAICVPLAGRYGVVGVIYVDTSRTNDEQLTSQARRNFNEEHLKLLVAIAHHAALAIEDTRYYSSMVQVEKLASMGQTITAISHHIKNILQGVKGGAYLVDDGIRRTDFHTVEKGWKIVERNQKRISDLVLDMLSYSKERRPEVESCNLNHIATDVLDILRIRAEQENTKVVFQPDNGIHHFMFDPDGIHRSLLNIVSNALDAVKDHENGEISVVVNHHLATQELRIVVADNGPGIPAESQEQIFHAFVSGKGRDGTGLGLAVSRKIIREHDGDIIIESDGKSGTRFLLQWPAVSPSERLDTLRDSSVAKKNSVS